MHAPAYWRRWTERFGYIPRVIHKRTIWLHAVSVGEVQAALPLIQSLRKRYPEMPMVVTTMTPTGSARVMDSLGENVIHVYVPYDLPGAVRRFLGRTNPCLAIIMETELWPNLFYYCHHQGIPVMVANARLSERSAKKYHRFYHLTRQTLQRVSAFAVQADEDASRFIELGADASSVHVTGNIKFDIGLPAGLHEQAQALRREWGQDRPIWIAASTHEGEEELVLEAFARVRKDAPNALLILVPRHPERFAKVAALCIKQGNSQGYKVVMRSEHRPCDSSTAIVIGDTMGELTLFYGASDVAFVGGSLVATGGHNVLEPAAMRLPVVFGPHMFNFNEISRLLLEAGAAVTINDTQQLAHTVTAFLMNASQRLEAGDKAYQVIEKNRGALDKMLNIIDGYLASSGSL